VVVLVTRWGTFGDSLIGPGHVLESKPNQDAWSSFRFGPSVGIVISDGLGSKKLANFGSKAACRAVKSAVRKQVVTNQTTAASELVANVSRSWLEALGPIDPDEASATCLFAYTTSTDSVVAGALGDGCIAIVGKGESVRVISPDKTSGFLNSTRALSRTTNDRDWTTIEIPKREVKAVIMFTDGIADDLEDVTGFAREICSQSEEIPDLVSSRQLRMMLSSWPVPKHTDDKTLACLIRKS
jgi:serine/threonine protein phosphatase PrpC